MWSLCLLERVHSIPSWVSLCYVPSFLQDSRLFEVGIGRNVLLIVLLEFIRQILHLAEEASILTLSHFCYYSSVSFSDITKKQIVVLLLLLVANKNKQSDFI